MLPGCVHILRAATGETKSHAYDLVLPLKPDMRVPKPLWVPQYHPPHPHGGAVVATTTADVRDLGKVWPSLGGG